MDQNHQLWVHPVSALALNFERLFKDCLCLMKDVPLVEILTNLSHICGRKGPEIPPPPKKGAISWMLHCHENIWKFIIWQLQMLH